MSKAEGSCPQTFRLRTVPCRVAVKLANVNRHPWRRLVAWFVDWLLVLGWVAITAAVGIPLFLSGVTRGLSAVALNLVATLVLVAPVTVGVAVLESGVREATIGKRARQLIVVNVATSQRRSLKRALLRNAVKIALPWTIGHAAVYGIVRTSATGCSALYLGRDRNRLRSANRIRGLTVHRLRTDTLRSNLRHVCCCPHPRLNKRHPIEKCSQSPVSRPPFGYRESGSVSMATIDFPGLVVPGAAVL